jgi:hypothetical protein
LDIENDLRSGWEEKQAVYITALKQTRLEVFSKLRSPIEEAKYDLHLFVSKYFLDENGAPDSSKTLEPLSLPGSFYVPLLPFSWRVPGLHVTGGGNYHPSSICVVGWNKDNVWEEANRIYRKEEAERKKNSDVKWKKLMQKHHNYVSRRPPIASTFEPKDAIGSYIVECDDIREQWSDMDDLRMDITRAGKDTADLVADFDFGVLDGMMRLALDHSAFDKDFYDGSVGPKRRRQSEAGRVTKKSRTSSTSTRRRRLYFVWLGRETGEGELQDDEENTGYLEFTDAGCTQFEAVAGLSFVGPQVKFRGFKISSRDAKMTKSWNDYTEQNYQFAKIRRWEMADAEMTDSSN